MEIKDILVVRQGVWQRSDPGSAHGVQAQPAHARAAGAHLQERDWAAEGDQPRRDAGRHGVRAPVPPPPVELHHAEAEHEENTHEG